MMQVKRQKSRQTISFVLILAVLVMVLQVPANSYADREPLYFAEADYLNGIGLFQGTTTGYNLEQMPDRQQGAVMVVRLLGKEKEAKSANYPHPFVDVDDWADAYVGYLYANHITTGQTSSLYGAEEPLTDDMFMTFILRVIGYTTPNDFQWNTAIEKAYKLGILSYNDFNLYESPGHTFLRDDMVHFSYLILYTALKNSQQTLYEQLVLEGVIVEPFQKGYFTSEELYYPYSAFSINTVPTSQKDLQRALEVMIFNWTPNTTFNLVNISKSDLKAVVELAIESIQKQPGFFSAVSGYGYTLTGNTLNMEFRYIVTKAQIEASRAKADQVIAQIITPDMTAYEKELAIHDYIVDHTIYNQTYEEDGGIPFSMYGVLIVGEAVCQGYAEAFDYLCALAGIDAQVVVGEISTNGEIIGHAWNMVKLDGNYYHVDVTWDDPTTGDGSNVKNHFYFNITDDEIAFDHFWDRSAYPKATSKAYNYYVVNGLMVYSYDEMVARLSESFANKMPIITLKYQGVDMGYGTFQTMVQSAGNNLFSTLTYQILFEFNIVEVSNIQYY